MQELDRTSLTAGELKTYATLHIENGCPYVSLMVSRTQDNEEQFPIIAIDDQWGVCVFYCDRLLAAIEEFGKERNNASDLSEDHQA